MSVPLPPGEVEAMRAIGARFVAELLPFAQMDAAGGPTGPGDVTAILASKVMDCLLLALEDADLPHIYAGVGLVLGCCYAQQSAEVKAQLDDILGRALSAGMDRSDGGADTTAGTA